MKNLWSNLVYLAFKEEKLRLGVCDTVWSRIFNVGIEMKVGVAFNHNLIIPKTASLLTYSQTIIQALTNMTDWQIYQI